MSGHSDIAIGSRLAPGSSVARGPKRELISRTYNLILRTVLATRVRDAQCGFKAVRADVARRLLPAVEDDGWFFDTELLVLAEHNGLRIHEVPVDWVDDPDSRVHVDPHRARRPARHRAHGSRVRHRRGRLELGATARPPLGDDFGRQHRELRGHRRDQHGRLARALPRHPGCARRRSARTSSRSSATFVGNTWANARFTAGVRRPRWRLAGAVYVGSLAVTSAALLVVIATAGVARAEVAVLLVTWMAVAVGRFALVRSHPHPDRHAA